MKCPHCDAEVKPDYEFCGICGACLAPQQAPPAALDPRFQRASDEYYRLRGQLATGRITADRFDTALKELMIQDAQGRWWALGIESGKWFVQSGGDWVQAVPATVAAAGLAPAVPADLPEPSAPAEPSPPVRRRLRARAESAPPPSSSSGGGCGKKLACGCMAVLVLCGALGAGGFVAYRSGMLTPTTLANLAGAGPADVQVDNFRDDALHVTISPPITSADSTPARTALEIKSFDVAAYRAATPGRYRVELGTARGGTNLGVCTLTIKSGDQYQFIALPDNIVVHRANSPASSGPDFVVSTSALCR